MQDILDAQRMGMEDRDAYQNEGEAAGSIHPGHDASPLGEDPDKTKGVPPAADQTDHDAILQAIVGSNEVLRQSGSSSSWFETDMGMNDGEDEEFERARWISEEMAAAASRSSDPGHLAGTTQEDFESGQRQQGGKTDRERTKEEVVMEYVQKQSLLEVQDRQSRGEGRTAKTGTESDEDLRRALKLSMRQQ